MRHRLKPMAETQNLFKQVGEAFLTCLNRFLLTAWEFISRTLYGNTARPVTHSVKEFAIIHFRDMEIEGVGQAIHQVEEEADV